MTQRSRKKPIRRSRLTSEMIELATAMKASGTIAQPTFGEIIKAAGTGREAAIALDGRSKG